MPLRYLDKIIQVHTIQSKMEINVSLMTNSANSASAALERSHDTLSLITLHSTCIR